MSIRELYDRSYEFGRIVGARGGAAIRIAVYIDPRLAAEPTAQLIAMAICNLLPRISERYTNVDLRVPASQEITVPRLRPDILLPHLMKTLTTACLAGSFQEVDGPEVEYDYCIVIGEECGVLARCAIYAWASGWRCFASKVRPVTHGHAGQSLNPFAALAVASLAVMMLYHDAEGLRELFHSEEIRGWSLLDYCLTSEDGPALPESIEVGRIVQAGLGGTANALLWALRHGPELSGEWCGFEHEMLEISNANRYLLMRATDVGSKAALVRERFGSVHPRLNFQAKNGRVEEECAGLLDSTLVLATVDDPQIRVTLQRRGAGIILNVGTNTQWLSVSRHEVALIREGGPCVGCFYLSNEQAPRRARESTVSFVVALVGAMLGGELMKSYCFPQHALANSWLGNVFAPAGGRSLLRPATPNCETCSVIRN